MRLQLAALAFLVFGSSYFICAQDATQTHTPPQISSDTPQQTPDSGVRIRASSRLVLVDVVVTDKFGNPVHGLSRKNFHLTEGSTPQQLSGFEEFTTASRRSRSTEPLTPLPPHVYTNLQPDPSRSAVNVLLLDALNTPIHDQSYVRQQMMQYLKTLQPGTRIAIFTLSTRLRILQGFTTDTSALLTALNTKGALPETSPLLDDPFAETLSDLFNTKTPALAKLKQFEGDQFGTRAQLRARYTTDALASIAAYLGGSPGRKNLIWFSGAFPNHVLRNFSSDAFSQTTIIADDVRRATNALTLNQIAVYPVDARGLISTPLFSAENSNAAYAHAGGAQRFEQDNQKFFQLTAADHATMDQIAEETGGHAF